MMIIVFYLCSALIILTWAIYPIFLLLLGKILSLDVLSHKTRDNLPFVSIIVAAKNEERNIVGRVENLLEQDFPILGIEIIIASDGSTDDTVKLSKQIGDSRIKILDFDISRGRASVHNDAVAVAKGEIVVFTDAETKFEKGFILKIVQPFRNREIGAAVGRLIYSNSGKSGITQAASGYWDYEAKLRASESSLGILAFGSGACTAFRKSLYQTLSPTEDIDYAQTLNVVRQGFKMVFVPDAIAFDLIAEKVTRTFTNRVRQTSRAFRSITTRLFSREIIKRPDLFLGILFHKTFRHLTPFFMLMAFAANSFLLGEGFIYRFMLLGQVLYYLVSGLGLTLNHKVKLPKIIILSSNFLLLNIGRFIGVLKAFRGHASAKY